jgi:hypothetical protein
MTFVGKKANYFDNQVYNENFVSSECVKILNTKTNIFYTPRVKPVDSEHLLPHTQLHHEHLVPEQQEFLLSSWQQLHELPTTEPTGWVCNQQVCNPCEPGSYKWQKRKLNHVSFYSAPPYCGTEHHTVNSITAAYCLMPPSNK